MTFTTTIHVNIIRGTISDTFEVVSEDNHNNGEGGVNRKLLAKGWLEGEYGAETFVVEPNPEHPNMLPLASLVKHALLAEYSA